MVTEIEERSVALPWDAFLDREADIAGVNPQRRQAWLDSLRLHIDRFRATEWKAIKRELAQVDPENIWVLPEGLEPHWVAPGKAIYWQEQRVRTRAWSEEKRCFVAVEESRGWTPCPSAGGGLPANNATTVAYYLRKGLRLRPPEKGVDVEALKVARLPEPQGESVAPSEEVFFRCGRHPQGEMAFKTWRGYIQHCGRYNEPPEEKPPTSILQVMQQFPYYCGVHNRGFKNVKAAMHHIRMEARRPRPAGHPDLASMEVPQAKLVPGGT